MARKIEAKIVDYVVVKEADQSLPLDEEEVVILNRPTHLSGTTYKIDPPTISSAMYVTINDYEHEDGSRVPFEIFIAAKTSDHQEYITAFTLILTALFRRQTRLDLIVDELLGIEDPRHAYFLPKGGGMCNSIVANIGMIVRDHCERIGCL